MIAISFDPGNPSDPALNESICLKSVRGGEETHPLWTSEVSDASFKSALSASLSRQGLLAWSPSDCEFDLTANVLGLSQPAAGFDMEVTAHVNYEMLHRGTDKAYFLKTVSTAYTATVGDAFAGIKRMRLANEGAVRANILEFLRALLLHKPGP